MATQKFPAHPKHPERICWGCEKLCPADDMRCGNGTIRAPHPAELFGDDWWEWSIEENRVAEPAQPNGCASPGLKPSVKK